jgi:RND family efflux transporter MFP subunit
MKLIFIPTLTVTALSICVLLAGCGGAHAPGNGDAKAALTVTLVSPSSSDWPEQFAANGSIAAWQESVIGAEVSGLKLDEVFANVGETVTKGQILARFSEETTRADLAQTEASVAEAEANLALARDRAERALRLEDTGTVSREDILQYNANEKTSAAKLASAQAQLEAQRFKLRYTQVLAPDDGVISSRTATVGAVLNAGSELFKLIRQNRLEWRAKLPADQLVRVAPGQAVTLRFTNQVLLNGLVRQVSPTVDPNTLDGTIYVDLPEPGALKAGMFISGDIQLGTASALHLPESALVYRDGYQYVMKVGADHRVHQVKVATGRRSGQAVEIIGDALAPSDQIVTSGGSFLNDGDTVQIAAEKPADTAKGARS